MSGYQSFAESYDVLCSNISYPERGNYFRELFLKFGGKTGILLDLACGTGSLSEVMSELGYDVIGVDSSPEMLSYAMQKKVESGRDILYLCQDMRELDLYGTVDCALCALDSLNHVTSGEGVLELLRRVALFLAPGGLFIFDVNSPYKHEKILSGNCFLYDYDEVFCAWQNSVCERGLVEITLDLFTPGADGRYDRRTECFEERAYSHDELCGWLAEAGLELLACYEGDSFDPPRADSERLVYVTRSGKSPDQR